MDAAVQQAVELVVSAPPSAFGVGAGEAERVAALAQALLERACALRAEAVALVDAHGEWRSGGSSSPQAWARDALGLTGGEAGALVRTARALHADLPVTREALWAGRLTWAHATTLARVALVTDVRRAAVAEPGGEQTLVEVAEGVGPTDLGRLLASWAHGVDAAGVEADEQRAFDQRRVSLAQTIGGMWHLEGLLDPVGGATLATALDAVIGAALGREGEERTITQVRADALVDLARRGLDAGELPKSGGLRPHLLVHVSTETLAGIPGAPAAELSPGRAAVSGLVARMLACDAAVTPVAWTPDGRLLDLGRTTRTVPPRLRLAVIARDRCCVFPGCARPAAWCEAHHIVFWSRGGRTALDSLCLLCLFHHRLVHAHDLSIVRSHDDTHWRFFHPDGTPWCTSTRRRRRARAPAA